ncbi:MAG: hypothetical protein N3A54_01260 [Patescibacteria group bacterium]|nr:hypothetical protein [Patescibacteria group bacterium]
MLLNLNENKEKNIVVFLSSGQCAPSIRGISDKNVFLILGAGGEFSDEYFFHENIFFVERNLLNDVLNDSKRLHETMQELVRGLDGGNDTILYIFVENGVVVDTGNEPSGERLKNFNDFSLDKELGSCNNEVRAG